ncbi:MAG: hypothetical protein AAGC49_07510 [Brevundimonas sp.]
MSTTASTSEYDRFGPWVDEVRTPDDVPRLYRDHPIDFAAHRLVLKVPRNIARRDATADMDLYDQLLLLDYDQLTVLSRRTGEDPGATGRQRRGYAEQHLLLEDVVAVQNIVNLLDARLVVHARDGQTVAVRYNGSAQQGIVGIVEALRRSVACGTPSATGQALISAARAMGEPRLPGPNDRDVALASDFHLAARHNPHLVPWAWHGRRRVAPNGTGIGGVVTRVLHAYSPMTLHGAVVSSDGRSLEIFGRHASLIRGGMPVLSAGRTIVPLTLDRVEVAAHPRYREAMTVVMGSGQSAIEVVVPAGSQAHELFASV